MTTKQVRFVGSICAFFTVYLAIGDALSQDGITTEIKVVRREMATVIPQASEIDALLLIEAARGSLAIAADYILKLSETNYMALAIPPRTQKQVIGYEDRIPYEIKYREEKVQVPLWKDIYEEYETFSAGGGTSTAARDLQKVKARRLVGREKIGTREETHLIADPNGPISRTHYRHGKPIFADGQDLYQAGVIGANALVFTALRKCGVPESHPLMEDMLKEFERMIESYAISDYTWDVAWLTAAFCNSSNKRYNDLRAWLVSKLVDGQIKEGPGRGFWGPVCIDTVLVPSMLAYEQKLNEERKVAHQRVKEVPANDRRRPALEKAAEATEAELEQLALGYRYVTQAGLRFNDPVSRFGATTRPNIIPTVSVAGLPYYYFNQTLADMENTFYALFAIREAHENGFLPEETRRLLTTTKRPVAPPEKPVASLARMAAALTSRQHPNGQWDECSTHQPITSFAPLGLPALEKDGLLSLETPVTHLSSVQGFACLLNAGRVVGLERLFSRYGDNARKAIEARDAAVISFLEGQSAGRTFSPYDFYLAVGGVQRHLGGGEERQRDLWLRMAYKLISLQNTEGTWGKVPASASIHSPSLFQFALKRAEQAHLAAQTKLEPAARKPFDADDWRRRHAWSIHDLMPAGIIRTAMAMLFLADGIRLPVAGYVPRDGAPRTPPPVMAKVLELLQTRDKVDVTHIVIEPAAPAANLTGIPVVFLTSDTDFGNTALVQALRRYCDNGGTIVAEIATTAQAVSMQPQLQRLVEGGNVVTIPESAPLFANFIGPKPSLSAIANSKGRPTVYIIPLDAIPASPAVQTAFLLVKDNVVDGFFDADYAWKIGAEEGAAMRVRILTQLQAEAALSKTPGELVPVAGSGKTDTGTIVPVKDEQKPQVPPKPAGPLPDEVW